MGQPNLTGLIRLAEGTAVALYNPARIGAAADLRRRELLAEAERERRSELATRQTDSVPARPAPAVAPEPTEPTLFGRLKTGWKAMTASGA